MIKRSLLSKNSSLIQSQILFKFNLGYECKQALMNAIKIYIRFRKLVLRRIRLETERICFTMFLTRTSQIFNTITLQVFAGEQA